MQADQPFERVGNLRALIRRGLATVHRGMTGEDQVHTAFLERELVRLGWADPGLTRSLESLARHAQGSIADPDIASTQRSAVPRQRG